MAKDAYYFSHDSNARNDVKMIKLRRIGGLEALGLYWCVLEMLREADGYSLPVETIEDICYELRIDSDKFEPLFITGLLEQNNGEFYSNSLKNRMVRLDEIKEVRAKAGQKGGKSQANAKQMLSKSQANAKQMLSNKSKVNYSKENDIREENIPTLDDFRSYAVQHKPLVNKHHVELKYKAWVEAGWVDGNGNKIKNWKSKLLNTLPHMEEVKPSQGQQMIPR